MPRFAAAFEKHVRLSNEHSPLRHAQLTAGSAAPVHDACGFVHSSLQGGDIEAEEGHVKSCHLERFRNGF